ncbi:MAG: hypothetical protein JZU62_10110 [Sulfuricurvum sp.]|uniref:hypothetical protein n=1 Tax=Sulfuricurvum sp. TaxID=2025608 RepID=UPI0025FE2CAD|nr:hypothetical protein [Sulfuricurvum sp.]MBV5322034.1 hypothetical protein [Sulfuricurvum sp.]MBV5334519.1 hypothetical protein [Sulfuricurvum sp.]
MDLKQQLIDFGCGIEFVEIALGYTQFYQPDQEIETFIEYVEEEHAKVEEAEALKEMENETIKPSDLNEAFKIFEEEEELLEKQS